MKTTQNVELLDIWIINTHRLGFLFVIFFIVFFYYHVVYCKKKHFILIIH